MNNFEELQSDWKNQSKIEPTEQGFQNLLTALREIKNKQRVSNVILSITVIILIGFFFYISGYNNQQVILGISFMIGSLLVRMLLELWSMRKLNKMNTLSNRADFRNELIVYYTDRKFVHFLWTPLILLTYVSGFLILLPLFKATLSTGFYTYIIVSSIMLLIFFSIFITKQIIQEMKKLERIQQG